MRVSAERLHAGRAFEAAFPQGAFGNAAGTAAQLAANPAGIAVVRLSLGSFDTHANQKGTHGALLRQLADGLTSLRAALMEINRWDSTVIATYAEFGRRPRENESGGTDHGTASASSDGTGTTGRCAAKAIPCTRPQAIRIPVNEPGPWPKA